jgi:hypothetical protein
MKAEIEFKIQLGSVGEFSELLNHVEFTYLQDIGLTQVGTYGDVRIVLELLKFVNLQLEQVILLRSENPDLMKEFSDSLKMLNKKEKEFKLNFKRLEKANENQRPT